MTKKLTIALLMVAAVSVTMGQEPAPIPNELLFEAARAGDVARIEAALAKGATVNATSRYNMTPLIFAASSGRFEAVKVLVARGANVNTEDSFYRFSAGEVAAMNGHVDIALFLLQNGWQGGDDLMLFSVQTDNAAVLKAALASSVTRQGVESAMTMAERLKRTALAPGAEGEARLAAGRHSSTFRRLQPNRLSLLQHRQRRAWLRLPLPLRQPR